MGWGAAIQSSRHRRLCYQEALLRPPTGQGPLPPITRRHFGNPRGGRQCRRATAPAASRREPRFFSVDSHVSRGATGSPSSSRGLSPRNTTSKCSVQGCGKPGRQGPHSHGGRGGGGPCSASAEGAGGRVSCYPSLWPEMKLLFHLTDRPPIFPPVVAIVLILSACPLVVLD